MTNQENLFRFISLRSAQIENKKGRLKMDIFSSVDGFLIYSQLVKAKSELTIEYIKPIIERFKQSNDYIDNLNESDFRVFDILDWISKNGNHTFKESNFLSAFERMLSMAISEIETNTKFNKFYQNICDSVFTDILMKDSIKFVEEKIRLIKVFYTLKSISNNSLKVIDTEIINDFFVKSTLIFPDLKIKVAEKKDSNNNSGTNKKIDQDDAENKKYLKKLEIAQKELSNLLVDNIKTQDINFVRPSSVTVPTNPTGNPAKPSYSKPSITESESEVFLTKEVIQLLSSSTMDILKSLMFDLNHINPLEAINNIETEIKIIYSKTISVNQGTTLIEIGNTYIDKEQLKLSIIGDSNSVEEFKQKIISNFKYEVGIGDLLIVKQKLKTYELAEFAHIENALAGEFKERIHRRLDSTETTKTTSTETEVQKEKDLQSTQRSEMQTESEKILKQQSQVESGVQITASYGPSLSVTASLKAGFSSSVQDSQKKATSFSKEIAEKSSEKIRTKVAEQQIRKTLSETEETNTHRIDNTKSNAKHQRGIYRWLNKIYEAQVFKYDDRMMYEFIIPEPAAFYLYATIVNPPQDSEITKPKLPQNDNGTPLSPSDITRGNYLNLIRDYNVLNAPTLPSQFTVKTFRDKLEGTDASNKVNTEVIQIPDGYEAIKAIISFNGVSSSTVEDDSWDVEIGGNFRRSKFNGKVFFHNVNFRQSYRSEISTAISYFRLVNGTITIDLFCNLTSESIEKWQLQVYDAIMQSYYDQKTTYDAKMEARSIQRGVNISGNNPLENRKIEKEELKKWIIMILSNSPLLDINSFTYSPKNSEPILDISKAYSNGKYIRFLENAFEWDNILYVFYSYFWGKKANWANTFNLTDVDIDFAAFKKAGAARVQLPVRKGFEKAIAYFCQTGVIWEGNDVPCIGDDLYLPIITEITENLGQPIEGTPYPPNSKPWEVVVPTSLVLLQDLSEIPIIRDMLSGDPVTIKPKKTFWQSILNLFS